MKYRKTKMLRTTIQRSLPKKLDLSLLRDDSSFSGVLRSEGLSEEKRSIGVVFSSESPVNDFPGLPPVILLHEPQAVGIEGFRSTGSVLWDHDTSKVVGRPDDPRLSVEERVCRATVTFDDDQFSDTIFRKVKSGSVRGVSVRARIEDGIVLQDREKWVSPCGKNFVGPVALATKWSPREVSLTPIPADQSVGVGRSDSREAQEDTMPEWMRQLLVQRGLVKADATDEELKAAAEKAFAEKEPVRSEPVKEKEEPKAASNALELMEFARRAGCPDEAIDWVKRGLTIESARAIVLEKLIATSPKIDTKERVEVGADATTKWFAAHGAVMARRVNNILGGRLNLSEDEKKLGGDIPRDLSLEEMIRRTCEHYGYREVRGWDRDTVAQRGLSLVCSPQFTSRALQHSTSDFPSILENVGNKALVAGFTQVPSTYQIWAGSLNVSDFKTHSRVNLSEAEQFVVNPELMPISESTVSEKKETYSIETYARRFGISRQAIINDDLSAFSRIPQMFGAAAARTMNKRFYTVFLAGKTMAEDSTALFATTHTSGSNLESGAAIDDTQLSDARKLMRLQKGFNAKDPAQLNLTPKYLLVPAALEHTCLKLQNGIYMPTTYTNSIPGWIPQLQLIVEPLLDANSTTAFYLIADSAQIDTVSVVKLNGDSTPKMTRIEGTSILGVEWVAYFDFGVAILEHRGMVKHTGAA